jgi:uncharacterized protein (UPF0264 family)
MQMSEPRISMRFNRRFSATSKSGRVAAWMKETYDDSAPDMMISAVKVLYLPLALAESGESEAAVQQAIKKSRSIFDERMRAALEPYFKAEEDSISRNGNVHLLGAMPSAKVNPLKSPSQEAASIREPIESSQEDDFELDESKLFEN